VQPAEAGIETEQETQHWSIPFDAKRAPIAFDGMNGAGAEGLWFPAACSET
jgi:hypothetical protein